MRFFSIAFWAFVAVSCVPFFVVALVLFVLTLPFDRRRVVLHFYSCFWAVFYLYANPFWSLRVAGREKLPWRGPAVIVANHASLIDILTLFALYRPFKWVSKASNFRLPFLGWNMWLNQVRGRRPRRQGLDSKDDEGVSCSPAQRQPHPHVSRGHAVQDG